jgi:hypothetical protein
VKRIHRAKTKLEHRHQSSMRHAQKHKNSKMPKDSKTKNVQNLRKEYDKAYERFAVRSEQKLLKWRNRPRIHPSHLKKAEHAAELVKIFGSDQRLNLFKELAANYGEVPSLENYLHMRRSISEAELDVAVSGGMEAVFALDSKLKKHGISPNIVAGTLDADEPAIDELSLRLMECLVARDKLPKSGPGYLEKRRQAIGDALVDYLIVMMLEAMEWNKSNPIVIPPSLIVLIRDRLCGPNPDWARFVRSQEEQENAAFLAAQRFKPGEKITSRKFADRVGVTRSTAARWLADPVFMQIFDHCRKSVASEPFQRQRAAFVAAEHIPADENVSAEKLATLADVPLEWATRWMADPEFLQLVESGRKTVASEDFQRQRAASIAAQYLPADEKVSAQKLVTLAGVTPDVAARWVADQEFQRLFESGRKVVAKSKYLQRKREAFIKSSQSKPPEGP